MLTITSVSSRLTLEGQLFEMEVLLDGGGLTRVLLAPETYEQLQQLFIEMARRSYPAELETPSEPIVQMPQGAPVDPSLSLEDLVAANQGVTDEKVVVAMAPPSNSSPPPEDESAVAVMGGDRLSRNGGIEEPGALDLLGQVGFFSENGVDREELDALDMIDDEPDAGEQFADDDDGLEQL